ncbi:2TM domain-containing protein [Flavobacterium sp. CLA17]|uniref:2TM domain-containing protein n=1 Tax=Flavobacterium sp. CLA17 TaxID=2724135 RepID=UPI00149152AD|nr:2TM domain-containing protein [Flavobacterium sp. CLA17]QSB28383.1 2TM domain-containing protein [Flavobacterium sp. CLA17]
METNCNKDHERFEFQQIFRKKAVKLRSFYMHALVYALGLVVFVVKEYYGVPLNFFPFLYLNHVVMIIWTSVFLFSAIDLFLSFKVFGEEWEERKLKHILEKRQKKQKWV